MKTRTLKSFFGSVTLAGAAALGFSAGAATVTGYEDFGDVAGVALWRATQTTFHTSTVADVAADGTVGDEYAMLGDQSAKSWKRFASNQSAYSAPGMLLVYDKASSDDETPVVYTQNSEPDFAPLSFGGLWVQTLAANGSPFKLADGGSRATEFGNASYSGTTLFKFDKSFTIDRQGTFSFLGKVNLAVAQDAVFTINPSYPAQSIVVPAGSTLAPSGAGTITLNNAGLTVNGTLDLSETTRPAINGNVNLYGTIVLPAGTEVSSESPFTVCTGTLSGVNVFVKIGDAEAVEKSFTAVDGAITAFADPIYVFTENYPTTVPQGQTYTFVGGDSAENTVVVDALDVRGTLKTQGYFSFTNYKSNGSTLDVETGSLTLDPGDNWFNGTLTVEAGATFVNALESDAVQYAGTFTANIYGTLDMGATRWSLGSNNTLNFHEGCTVTGSGQSSNGTFDWIESATGTLNVDGDVTLAAPIKIRSTATVNVNVDTTEQKGLTLAGTIGVGKIVKKGAGLVKFTTNPLYAITVERGAFTFAVDATPTITYSAKPGAGTSMSMWYAKQATWKGTVVIGALSTPSALPLDTYGNANSKIVLTGTTGNCYLNGTTTVAAELVVGTNENSVVEFNNGNSDQVGTFSKVSGPGTLKLVGWAGCRAATYVLNTIDNFDGLAVANNITRTGGGTFTVRIGNIVTTRSTNPGDCVLPIAQTAVANATGTVVYDLANAQVNGNTLDLEAKDDGIYVAEPTIDVTVPVVANTVVTVTVGGETVSPKTEGGNVYAVAPDSVVTVTYAAADGYEISGTTVYTVNTANATTFEVAADMVTAQYVAQIKTGKTTYENYTTLADALDSANIVYGITLLADVTENNITVDSAVTITGNNHTINANVTIANGGQLQLMLATLNGTLTIQDGGTYVTLGGTLGNVVVQDGGIINLTTLSEDAAPLTVSTLTVNGALTIVSSYGLAERGKTYKAISYATGSATIAEGASFNGSGEWSASTVVDGDNTIVCLEITKVAVVDGVYYDTAQEAVEAAVASGKQAQFLVQPGTVTLGAGETLVVKGANQPTVELDAGLSTSQYEIESTYDLEALIYTYAVKALSTPVSDGNGNTFTVPAVLPGGYTATAKVPGKDYNYAQAYAVGLIDSEGTVSEPTVSIVVEGGVAKVVFEGGETTYDVTCTLYSFALADADDETQWSKVATAGLGETLTDSEASDTAKFYKVKVSIKDAE